MDTKERILEGARALFNAEGLARPSAVDVASALGISPGHLYYHFRGKAELAAALIDRFSAELDLVLAAADDDLSGPGAGVETLFTHVHILLEEIGDAVFVFADAAACEALGQSVRVRTILARLDAFAVRSVERLVSTGAIEAGPEVRHGLARGLALGLAFGLVRARLEGDPAPSRALVARTAAEIMLPIAGAATRL